MFRITMIGQANFEHAVVTAEQGADYFKRMGYNWYEALSGKIPAFVVTKLDPKEIKELQKVEV